MSKEKLYAVKNDEGKYWDFDFACFGRRELPGCYVTTIKQRAEIAADEHGGHVVTLIEEPEKIVLPKDVADAISFAKFIGVTFDRYIVRELTRSDYKDAATYTMIQSPDVLNGIEVLLNAWNNGYTVAKEKHYVLPMPGTEYHNNVLHGNVQYYAVKGAENWRTDVIALDTDYAVKHGYTVTQSDIDTAPDWVKAITPVEVDEK